MFLTGICRHRRDPWRNAFLSASVWAEIAVPRIIVVRFRLQARFVNFAAVDAISVFVLQNGKVLQQGWLAGPGNRGIFREPRRQNAMPFCSQRAILQPLPDAVRHGVKAQRGRAPASSSSRYMRADGAYGWLASFQRAVSCTVHVYMQSSRQCQGMKLAGAGAARRNKRGRNWIVTCPKTLDLPRRCFALGRPPQNKKGGCPLRLGGHMSYLRFPSTRRKRSGDLALAKEAEHGKAAPEEIHA
jgi:hypothetical protein